MESARFHFEKAHQERARDALPFARSSELGELVAAARNATARSSTVSSSSNPYALQSDTLGLLEALLSSTSPTRIVEFGAGESTIVFADWAARHGARILSIEHDRAWVEKTKVRLSTTLGGAVDLRHAPLKFELTGLRAFLTYESLGHLIDQLAAANFVLIDGPHISGRDPVIHAVLSHVTPGTLVVIDDFRHYAVREMLLNVPPAMASDFAGEAIEDNAHGLYVLRRVRIGGNGSIPRQRMSQILRSYWRCWRDFRQYGTGD